MARYFNYNTDDTDEIKIDFVLFNTIAKDGKIDQWKKNLYFIALFNMRNLPFRLDYTTYLPPLLYDVIIPGVKRLPFCYVSSFTATPYGLTRNMQIENFLGKIGGADSSKNTKVNVPIPEAWGISITFKSMLARSANLMLAGGADLPISINMSNNGLQEQLDKEFKASEAKAEKEAEAKRQKEAEEAKRQKEAEENAKKMVKNLSKAFQPILGAKVEGTAPEQQTKTTPQVLNGALYTLNYDVPNSSQQSR